MDESGWHRMQETRNAARVIGGMSGWRFPRLFPLGSNTGWTEFCWLQVWSRSHLHMIEKFSHVTPRTVDYMTRENKLALIIGFSLMLVVAILITDHFSPAQGSHIADLGNPANVPEQSLPLNRALPAVHTAATAGVDNGLRSNTSDINDEQRVSETNGFRAEQSRPAILDLRPGHLAAETEFIDMGEQIPAVDEPRRQSPVHDTDLDQKHRVVSGDTLSQIATRYYGDSALMHQLAAYNKEVMLPGLNVELDTEIRLPSRQALTGEVSPAQVGDPVQPSRNATDPVAPEVVEYTIQSNDTLGEISSRMLGTIHRMDEILELNPSLKNNPDNVRLGDVIRVPAR